MAAWTSWSLVEGWIQAGVLATGTWRSRFVGCKHGPWRLGDADSRFLEDMASTGVALGVRGEISWVEAVYEKKERKGDDSVPPTWDEEEKEASLRGNYASAKDHTWRGSSTM